MKNKLLKTIILIWTLFSLIVNLYFYAFPPERLFFKSTIIMVVVEGFFCWVAYQMFKGKKWALILLTVYYGLHILNIFTDNFSFYTYLGFNLRIKLGESFGTNLCPLIIFILLLILLFSKTKSIQDYK